MCRSVLFGFIPLDPPYGMRDLVDEAKKEGRADALIDITVDFTSKWWVLGSTYCHELQAIAVRFP